MNRKFFLKRIGIILIGCSCLFSMACTSVKADIQSNVKNEQMQGVPVKKEIIKINEDYIQGNISIPIVKNLKNQKSQEKINTLLKENIMNFVNSEKEYTESIEQKNTEKILVTVTYEITYNQQGLISVLIHKNAQKGKDYTFAVKDAFTIDLNTGKPVNLYQLFDPKEDYKQKIKDYIVKKHNNATLLRKQDIKNDQYYLKDNKIIIYFDPYLLNEPLEKNLEYEIPFDIFEKGINIKPNLKPYAVQLKRHRITEKNKYLITNINMPVLEGLENETLQQKINKMIEKEIIKFKDQAAKNAQEDYEEAKKYGYNIYPHEINIEFDEKKNEENILSLYVTYYNYTGGAHGSHNDITYNIDLKTGELIQLKDLFKKGYDYKKIINQKVKQQIDQINQEDKEIFIKQGGKAENYSAFYQGFESIHNDHHFYLNNDKIGIYFDLYEIACYATGIPTFEISLSELKDGIKDEYINALF
jgi:hypothetical protein